MQIRRVVAGTDAGSRSVILSDGLASHSHDFTSLPGQSQTRIFAGRHAWRNETDQPALVAFVLTGAAR
jgi:hypothetical protein